MAEAKTSEDVMGFVEQPGPICYHVDQAHMLLAAGQTEALIAVLETIRQEAKALREWGQDWKNEAERQIQSHDHETAEKIESVRQRRSTKAAA